MYKIKPIILVSLLSFSMCTHAQARRIYLGKDMDSVFVKDILHPVQLDSFSAPCIFGCVRLFLDETDAEQNDRTINRAGILLPAKSTESNLRKMRAVYTTGRDTCEVIYTAVTESVTNGRSAALSMLSLFARLENKIHQGPPVTSTDYQQLEGVMHSDHLEAPFRYVSDSRKNIFHTGGWLIINGDTLLINPPSEQINRRGKIKKLRNIFNTGNLIVKGRVIVGAIDLIRQQPVFYLHFGIGREEKLLITAMLMLITDH